MADVVLHGVRILYHINKDEGDESLPFLVIWRHFVNAIFLKYLKEGTLSLTDVGNRNTPLDVCDDVTRNITRGKLNTGALRTILSI